MDLITVLEEKGVHLKRLPNHFFFLQCHFGGRLGHLTFQTFHAVELFRNGQSTAISTSSSQGFHQSSIARMTTESVQFEHTLSQVLQLLICHLF